MPDRISAPHLVTSSATDVGRRDFTRLALGSAAAGWAIMSGGLVAPAPAMAADLVQLGTVARMQKLSGATQGSDTRSLTIGDKIYRNDLLWTRTHGQLRIDLLAGALLGGEVGHVLWISG